MKRALLALGLAAAALLPSLHVSAASHARKPYVVVLDPGHGGPYIGGADSTGTLVEKTLTLKIALATAKDLRSMGYKVFLTRTKDRAVNTPPRDLNGDGVVDELDDLDARALFANHHHAAILVSIHLDAGAPSSHGPHGYYCPARPFWRSSEHLAALLTAHIASSLTASGYPSPDNGVATDVSDIAPQRFPDYPWFFVLGPSRKKAMTASQMPGALIESLFLTSAQDDAALRRSSTIPAIARGYAAGIRAYFNGRVYH